MLNIPLLLLLVISVITVKSHPKQQPSDECPMMEVMDGQCIPACEFDCMLKFLIKCVGMSFMTWSDLYCCNKDPCHKTPCCERICPRICEPKPDDCDPPPQHHCKKTC